MIRCLIFCAFLGCSLLAVSPALGQEPKDEASAPPPATAPVTAEPADRPDLSPLDAVPAKAAPAETQIKIFKLENVAAKEAEKIITQLFGQDLTTLAADERSNHLIVRDDNADRLQNIEAILLKLDESAKKQHLFLSVNSLTTANPFAAEITGPGPGVMSSRPLIRGDMAEMMGVGNHGMLPTNRVDQAKAQYQTAEKHTAQLAAELQQRSKSNPKDPQILALKKQLQNAVADAFAKRQRLHKMELAELETRVQKVQESLNAREAIRDQIIERRVEELLNPNVNWDSSAKSDPKPAVQKAASIPAPVQGVIEFRDEKELVGISMGQNDGMSPQTQLHVFTGNRHLGRIEVVQVHPDKSVARILEEQPGVPMRPGDQVTNRWPLESGQQSPIGLPGPAHLPEVPGRPGKGDTSSLGPTGDAQDAMTVQLHILGPKGAALDWDKGAKDDALALGGTLPLRGAAETGQRVSFRIMNIPGREELQLWPSVELAPNNPLIEDFLKHNAIPVEFTAEDLDQFAGGNLITKVIYLFPREADKKPVYELETLVSTKLDPGVDPVAEARRRGHVLAVVRLVRSISKSQLSYDPLQPLPAPIKSQVELTREQLESAISKQQEDLARISKQLAAEDESSNEKTRLKFGQIRSTMDLLDLAVQLARTHPEGSDVRKKQLQSTANAYEELYQKHRSQLAGVHARYLQARCLSEAGDREQATRIYSELLDLPDEVTQFLRAIASGGR